MNSPTVFLIDDDLAVRDSISLFFTTCGVTTACFDDGESFLTSVHDEWTGCIVLDMKMPGMSGCELQERLLVRGVRMPIIFLTAYVDIPATVNAMKHGAYDFLTKPVDLMLLHQRVKGAFELGRRQQKSDLHKDALRKRLATLTEREREILSLAIAGLSNKEISQQLGISHRTVEVHRSHILVKTGANNLLELAQSFIEADKPFFQ